MARAVFLASLLLAVVAPAAPASAGPTIGMSELRAELSLKLSPNAFRDAEFVRLVDGAGHDERVIREGRRLRN